MIRHRSQIILIMLMDHLIKSTYGGTCSLQPGEKLTKYAEDIWDLCQRLQLDQQHMVSFFIKGLPKKYSTILAPLQPENINSTL